MIITEDSDFIFEEEFPTAIPITIVHRLGEEVRITSYPETEIIAHEFEKIFQNDYFTDEAVKWLDEKITPIMKTKGYDPNRFTDRWLYNYEINSPAKVNKNAILPNTVKVISPDDEGLKNKTAYPFDCECEDDDAFFCTVENKKILSAASINSYPEGSIIREIAVETCLSQRKKGYAASNAAALALYLSELGYLVKYSCQRYNAPSRHVALRAGFEYIGKSHYCVYYN